MSSGIGFQVDPVVIREGVFGASFMKEGEPLFLRMELLTEVNAKGWERYKDLTYWVANSNSRGVLSNLVQVIGKWENSSLYEETKDVTGFTREEYEVFRERALAVIEKTNGKIVTLLQENSTGSLFMHTGHRTESESHYVVYVTKNPDFLIERVDVTAQRSLKGYIESYGDILISMGSDFSHSHCFYTEPKSFHNRGIFRNPHWVFEGKYAGLSMLLHGFTAAVASQYFPEKTAMRVKPLGSMQCLLIKHLCRGEGYYEIRREGYEDIYDKKDVVDIKCTPSDPEMDWNVIKVSALTRIYAKGMQALM